MAATGHNILTTSDTISFRDQTTGVASIAYDYATDTLSISNDSTGSISFGDTASDIYIGDGTSNVDLIFEANGAIKGDAGVDLTLGSSDSNIFVASPMTVLENASFSGSLTVGGNPVMTGVNPFDEDTLQTVTDRGSSTTNTIRIESTDFASLVLDRGASNASIVQFENDNGIVGGIGGYNDDGLIFRSKDGNQMALNASNNFGIGTINPLGKLHVRSANAGSFTYDTNADDVIVESNANGGITIATAAANTSRVIFASPDDATGGEISFNQTAKLMKIGPTTANGLLGLQSANGVETMRLDASNRVGIGTTSPSYKLEVDGTSKISPSSGQPTLYLERVTGQPNIKASPTDGYMIIDSDSNYLSLNHYVNKNIILGNGGGNVGVGITNPNDVLQVKSSMSIVDSDGTNMHCQLFSNSSEGVLRIHNGANWGLIAKGQSNNPYLGAYYGGSLNIVGFGASDGSVVQDSLAVFDFGNSQFKLYDSKKLVIGNGADLQIYHNGTQSYIHNDTGDLNIENDATDGDIFFKSDDGSGGITNYLQLDGGGLLTRAYKNFRVQDDVYLQAGSSGDLEIVHASNHSYINNKTGDLYITNSTDDGDVIFRSDNGSGGVGEYFRLDGSQSDSGSDFRYTRWQDFSVVALGSNNDLQLYHNGTDSYISNYIGDLLITNNNDDGDIVFKSDDGSGGTATYLQLDGSSVRTRAFKDVNFDDSVKATFGASSDLKIYHNGSHSYVVNNTGDLEIINNTDDGEIKLVSDDGSGGTATYVSIDGSAVQTRFYKNTRHSDGVIALFGSGNDLQIFHDGSNSYIQDTGTGNFNLQSNSLRLLGADASAMLVAHQGGAVNLYHNNSAKLETTSTGIYVGGNINLPDAIGSGQGILFFGAGNDLQVYHDGFNSVLNNTTGNLQIYNNADDGDIQFISDDGSGGVAEYLRLDGSLGYTVASKHILLNDGVKLRVGSSADLEIYHDGSNSFIKDIGTGSLYIDGSQNVFIRDTNGQVWFQGSAGGVNLRYQDSVKIQTENWGVSFTGNTVASGNVYAGGGQGFVFGSSISEGEYIYRSGNDIRVLAGGADRLTVDGDAGNVGIGTTNPQNKLHVVGTRIRLDTNSGGYYQYTAGGAFRFALYDDSSKTHLFADGDGAIPHMTFNAGFVGIGTENPFKKLDLGATSSETDIALNYSDSGTNLGQIGFALGSNKLITGDTDGDLVLRNSVSGKSIIFGTQSTERVRITSAGNVGIGTTSPSGLLQVGQYTVASQGNQSTYGNLSSFANSNTDNIFLGLKNGSYPNRGYAFKVTSNGVNSDFTIKEHGLSGDRFTIQTGGNVGIGTTNPSDNLTVEGGGITLGGTGRIQGVDTVTDATDAANKAYVDAQVGASDTLQEVTDNGNTTTNSITMTNSLTIDGQGSSTDALKLKGSARIQIENASATDSFYISNTGGSGASKLDLGGAVSIVEYGSVGIGTTSPDSKLSVTSTSNSSEDLVYLKSGADQIDEYLGIAFETLVGGNGPHAAIRVYNGPSASDSYMSLLTTTNGGTLTQGLTQNHLGKVGIGTNSPAQKFSVDGGSVLLNTSSEHQRLFITSSPSHQSIIYFGDSDSSTQGRVAYNNSSDLLYFNTNGSTKMTILSGGNVGIGCTPNEKLEVNGNIRLTDYNDDIQFGGTANMLSYNQWLASASGGMVIKNVASASTGHIAFETSQGEKVRILRDGNVGIGTTAPSVGLQLGNSVSGQTKTAIFNSEGGSEVGLTIQSRTNRAKLRVADNDSNAYVVAEAGKAFFGTSSNGDANNITVLTGGNVGIGTTSPAYKLDVAGSEARIGSSSETTTSLYLTATNTAGAPAIAVQTIMQGYEGRALGTFYTDTTYSGEEWFCGMNYSGNFDRWSVGYDQSGGQAEYLANAKFTVFHNGYVGIGETAPEVKLEVAGDIMAKDSFVSAGATASQGYTFHDFGTGWGYKGVQNPSRLSMFTNSAERVTIASNGSVGIGTTSPVGMLSVVNPLVNTNTWTPTNKPDLWVSNEGTSNSYYAFGITTSSGDILSVTNAGNVGIGTISPSAKLDVSGNIYPTTDNTYTLGEVQTKEWSSVATRMVTGNNNRMVLELSGDVVILRDHNSVGDGVQIKNQGSVVAQFGDSTGSGNVGIGTTSPSYPLEVAGAGTVSIAYQRTGVTGPKKWGFHSDSSNTYWQNLTDNVLALTVSNAGNVGIGTANPSHRLDVESADETVASFNSTDNKCAIALNDDDTTVYLSAENGKGAFGFQAGTHANNLNIDVSGNVGIGTNSPNFKLEVVGDSTSGILAVRNAANARDTFRSENAAGTRTFNIGNDANGHGLVLVRGAGGTATSQIAGNGDTYFDTDTLYIDHSTNRVGIGTTNPSYKLSVSGGDFGVPNGNKVYIGGAIGDSVIGYLGNTSGKFTLNSDGNRDVIIGSGTDTDAVFIKGTNGNVGIGTTSPNAKLELAGKQMITAGANASPQTEDYLYIGGDGLAGADAAIYIGNRGNGSGYGWRMFYEGTGSGVNNKLKFKSENLGSPVDVITMLQDGKVGIGVTNPSYALQVGGSIVGTSKNFIIDHPTKEGKKLLHGCIEGPEAAVYFRGKSTSNIIEMPDYWIGLVDIDTMTVDITPWGPNQDIYVESIADDGEVTIAANTEEPLNYFYVVYGERKDIDKLEIEIVDPEYSSEQTS